MVSTRLRSTPGASRAETDTQTPRRRAAPSSPSPAVSTQRRSRRLAPISSLDPVPEERISARRLNMDEDSNGDDEGELERLRAAATAADDSAAADDQSDDGGATADDDDDDGDREASVSEDEEDEEETFLSALAGTMSALLDDDAEKRPISQVPADGDERHPPPDEGLRLKGTRSAGDDDSWDAKHWNPPEAPPPTKGLKAAKASTAHAALLQHADKPVGWSKQTALTPLLSKKAARRAARAGQPETKGKGWFDLPAQTLDSETKNSLRVLKLRGAFDPKRFYRSADSTKLPKFFQFGTVVAGAQDFYTGRLTAKQQKRTLAEEILHDASIQSYRKRKVASIQAEASRFPAPTRKTRDGKWVRVGPKPKRPKH